MSAAETRKEEILRFSKAKADPEFARMLRARTLGPDAAETQGQLRKQIRVRLSWVSLICTTFTITISLSMIGSSNWKRISGPVRREFRIIREEKAVLSTCIYYLAICLL